jgi:hypothetical protein
MSCWATAVLTFFPKHVAYLPRQMEYEVRLPLSSQIHISRFTLYRLCYSREGHEFISLEGQLAGTVIMNQFRPLVICSVETLMPRFWLHFENWWRAMLFVRRVLSWGLWEQQLCYCGGLTLPKDLGVVEVDHPGTELSLLNNPAPSHQWLPVYISNSIHTYMVHQVRRMLDVDLMWLDQLGYPGDE